MMIHRALRVKDWTCDFFFVVDGRNDTPAVMACLYDYGADDATAMQAFKIMDEGAENCGFTASNQERRRALSWIGPQSEGKQWINTSVHEIVHVAVAIAAEKGIDPFSEEFAYLCGDITQEIADILCDLACDRCREHLLSQEK